MLVKFRANMQQMDLFEETLEKEMANLKKWMARIQKRMWFLEQVIQLKQYRKQFPEVGHKPEHQEDMFVG